MFSSCTALQSLDTSKWNLSNLNNGSYMFYGCTALQSLDTSKWRMNNVTNLNGAFQKIPLLKRLDTSEWASLDKLTIMSNTFSDCTNLVSIDLSDRMENCSYFFSSGNKNLISMVGNHSETDNIRLLIGYNQNIDLTYSSKINLATVNAIIRGVANSPSKQLTLQLPEPVKSQITDEYRTILINKNWVIV